VEKIYTFGKGNLGQLGLGNEISINTPTVVNLNVSANTITCGYGNTLVTADNNTRIFAWGWNGCAQLGIGTTKDSVLPEEVLALHGEPIKKIVTGRVHSFALLKRGRVSTVIAGWGLGKSKRLIFDTKVELKPRYA